MASTTEKTYRIRFKEPEAKWFDVIADTIHEPDDEVATSKIRFYVFELAGEVVAKYKESAVIGWRIVP